MLPHHLLLNGLFVRVLALQAFCAVAHCTSFVDIIAPSVDMIALFVDMVAPSVDKIDPFVDTIAPSMDCTQTEY